MHSLQAVRASYLLTLEEVLVIILVANLLFINLHIARDVLWDVLR